MNPVNLTVQEFDSICQRNDNFNGKVARMDKMNAYKEVCSLLEQCVCTDADCVRTWGIPPAPEKPNAMALIEVKNYALLLSETKEKMAACISKSDVFGMTMDKDNGVIRLSFSQLGVWEE